MVGFLTVSGLTAAVAPALADALSVRQGEQLAQTWCATCHVVGVGNQDSATAGIVSFAHLAARPGFDEEQLAVALFSPHPAMPSMNVTRTEITALFDYIISLKTGIDGGAAETLTE